MTKKPNSPRGDEVLSRAGSTVLNRREITKLFALATPVFTTSACFQTSPEPSSTKELEMEKVIGIGGFFFRSDDPESLSAWYQSNLGIDLAPQKSGGAPWQQDAGFTIFDPFERENEMIPAGKSWMINFRVNNLERMVEQLRHKGNQVSEIEDYPHGRFAELSDPEGNGIQLWQPAA